MLKGGGCGVREPGVGRIVSEDVSAVCCMLYCRVRIPGVVPSRSLRAKRLANPRARGSAAGTTGQSILDGECLARR